MNALGAMVRLEIGRDGTSIRLDVRSRELMTDTQLLLLLVGATASAIVQKLGPSQEAVNAAREVFESSLGAAPRAMSEEDARAIMAGGAL